MSERILLVDDEPRVLRALEREMEEFAVEHGVRIVAYDSPVTALQDIREDSRDIAVVVSDQKMPYLKGFHFLQKAKEENPDIVPVLLSAYTDIDDIIASIRVGLFSFVLKPWDIDQLLHEVRKGLNLHRLRKENDRNAARLNEALKWGGEIQKKLLESRPPADRRIAFSVNYTPMARYACGGDYYDIVPLDSNRYLALMGDVSGHGVKAAFITFILKTLLNEIIVERRQA
ncbi:MAG: response regulator, partial [Desulfobacterales bacterium]|nr:response regulator [Desulfobacterales bacterium]